MGLLIKGGRVIDPSQGIDEVIDILVEDGIIKELGKHLKAEKGCETIRGSRLSGYTRPDRHACPSARSRTGV